MKNGRRKKVTVRGGGSEVRVIEVTPELNEHYLELFERTLEKAARRMMQHAVNEETL
jgi:hypothetical protein